MKNKDTNAKSDNLLNGGKNGVCKDFKDIWKLMDLVTELQNSEQISRINGARETEEKINHGNRSK